MSEIESERIEAASAHDEPTTWAGALVGGPEDEAAGREAARFGGALLAAAALGAALGLRGGPESIARHAVGAPAALLVVGAVGVPALCIVLSLLGVPIAPARVVSLASRGAASAGVVLAGLAPAVALFVRTSAAPDTAALAGAIALATAGAFGLLRTVSLLRATFAGLDSATRILCGYATVGFAVFATVLGGRLWWSLLPMLHGGAS